MINKRKFFKILILFILLTLVGLEVYIIREHQSENNFTEGSISASGSNNEFKSISYKSYKDWEKIFLEYDYDLNKDIIDVPQIAVKKFPEDINQIRDAKKRKELFLSIMLIGAYHANQEILKDRAKLNSLVKQYNIDRKLQKEDNQWLNLMIDKYNVEANSVKDELDELLYKVDIIPLSLVLSQAACESGWGTSRFTKVANNIFGEWTFSENVAGVVPKARPANATYKIRKFDTIEEAIASYLNNLNSHYAYEKLWDIRSTLRNNNQNLDSLKLAAGLINYSERREDYVEQVKDIIEYNNLKKIDKLLKIK
ncbi:glucosaminidase domain-containing protein [Orenia marismortui]|uniref:glucosaminidase domain-containing protein n=1 Tax=Orenia marismortui TaxID=46469 RepID=UPI00036B78A9|nr:glucosaminidase domain-containing protein [Orenia marismortui]